jgi:hypothetical protein
MSWETVLTVKVMMRKISQATLSIDGDDDDDDVCYVEHDLAGGEVESHHGLYSRHDGILEELLCKMLKVRGR